MTRRNQIPRSDRFGGSEVMRNLACRSAPREPHEKDESHPRPGLRAQPAHPPALRPTRALLPGTGAERSQGLQADPLSGIRGGPLRLWWNSTAPPWPFTTVTTDGRAAWPTPYPPGLNFCCAPPCSPTSWPPASTAAYCSPITDSMGAHDLARQQRTPPRKKPLRQLTADSEGSLRTCRACSTG